MTRRRRLLASLVAVLLGYGALLFLDSRWLPDLQIDLTQDHLYTLAPGTEQVIGHLQRPLYLTLYFSGQATRDLPQLRSYEQRVREMLEQMVARSGGDIRMQVIDPAPYSDDEATALGNGITPLNIGSNGERVFFGLLASTVRPGATDGDAHARTLAIPFFDPQRQAFLEYDIARLLFELGQTRQPLVGVLGSLPLFGTPPDGQGAWAVMRQLGQMFDLRAFDAARLKAVPKDIHVLLVVHPKDLPPDAQYAIDQFVLRGDHLVVFVDPDAEMDTSPPGANGAFTHGSDLPRLFADWGVLYDPTQVVLDRSRALQIELPGGTSLQHPAMLGLGGGELNRADPITASLQRINVSTAGHFDLAAGTSARLEPLIQTSADAELVPVQRVLDDALDPSLLDDGYQPTGQRYVLAARLHGRFVSAFPERATQPGHLAVGPADGEIVLVADTDLLSDRLWLDTENVLGQPLLTPFANNGEFLSNIVGNLSGSSALLSIPGNNDTQRPFTRVLALQSAADRRFKAKKDELQQELDQTRRQLLALQQEQGAGGTPSAEQQREIELGLRRQLELSRELREVQHQFNAEIDALGLHVKLVNIVLVPAWVTLFGLLYGWRRLRRRRQRG